MKILGSFSRKSYFIVLTRGQDTFTFLQWQVLNVRFFSGLETGKPMMMKTVIPRPFHLTSKSTARFVNLTPRFTGWKDLILHVLGKERAISYRRLAGFSFIHFFLETAGVYKAKLDLFNKD